MATRQNLESILSTIRSSEYRNLVRARNSSTTPEALDTLKSGGDELYFNMAPSESFTGNSVQLSISNCGEYRLGASFGRSGISKEVIFSSMKSLTGNTPVYGTDREGNTRDDILRCTINTEDESSAQNLFLAFYNKVFP